MRILVTGTEGYLGSLLAPRLMAQGHEVVGLDTGYYMTGWLYQGVERTAHTLIKDLRHVEAADLEGFNAVVHMAELSNDPTGELRPGITHEINHQGSVKLAELAKAAGVERFVYMSSCSVYGIAEGELDETSPVNPQTAYAECKTLVERDLAPMADDDFSPTFLRNATAFGASTPHAIRHRVEQPVGPGLDHEGDRDDLRRVAVAAARPRPRHRQGHRVRTGRTRRRDPQRGVQRRRHRAELPGTAGGRDRGRRVPRL